MNDRDGQHVLGGPAPTNLGEIVAYHLPACPGRPQALIMVVRPMVTVAAAISTYLPDPDYRSWPYLDTWEYARLSQALICARTWAAHPDRLYPLGAL